MPGDRVRVKRVGNGILLEPFTPELGDVFAEIDQLVQGEFPDTRREQPAMPSDDDLDSLG
ncbi:MAG TPA: hypothetical protein VHW02_02395 [Rhizomicrobium sp.]|nr:hypothetical protein [Rhizomicrobium sp.]